MSPKKTDSARCEALVGRTCIFREKHLLLAVEVRSAKVEKGVIVLQLRVLPLPGFGKFKESFEVSTLGVGDRTSHLMGGSYAGWLLCDAPAIVEAVTAYAASLLGDEKAWEKLNEFLFRSLRSYEGLMDPDGKPSDET